MVSSLNTYLATEYSSCFFSLDQASDNICTDNGKRYLDFDKFVAKLYQEKIMTGNTISSCDILLFNTSENHLIFVECKDMCSCIGDEMLKKWWDTKKQSIYLKIPDSLLCLSHFIVHKKLGNHDTFFNSKRSFFYVYKSTSYKNKIRDHINHEFSRYKFQFVNMRNIEVTNFESFLQGNNL